MIVDILLHSFESFWSSCLSQKKEAERNTLSYAGHGILRRLARQHSIKEDRSLESGCRREHINVIATDRIKDDTSELALGDLCSVNLGSRAPRRGPPPNICPNLGPQLNRRHQVIASISRSALLILSRLEPSENAHTDAVRIRLDV